MICIKLLFHDGLVVRLDKRQASQLVAEKRATWSTKGAWKRCGRRYGIPGEQS